MITIIQQNYCSYYVLLLQQMLQIYPELSEKTVEKCKQDFHEQTKLFEKYKTTLTTQVNSSQDYDDYCEYQVDKKKVTGLFYLVGMLYKYKLVKNIVIKKYWKLLISNIFSISQYKELLSIYSESICKFVEAIGNTLLQDYPQIYNKDFETVLQEYSQNRDVFPPRIRFLFIDCLEHKKWVE